MDVGLVLWWENGHKIKGEIQARHEEEIFYNEGGKTLA